MVSIVGALGTKRNYRPLGPKSRGRNRNLGIPSNYLRDAANRRFHVVAAGATGHGVGVRRSAGVAQLLDYQLHHQPPIRFVTAEWRTTL